MSYSAFLPPLCESGDRCAFCALRDCFTLSFLAFKVLLLCLTGADGRECESPGDALLPFLQVLRSGFQTQSSSPS